MAYLNPPFMADQLSKWQAYLATQDAFGNAFFAAQAADAAVTTAQAQLSALTKVVGSLSDPNDGIALIQNAEKKVADAQATATAAHATANNLRQPIVDAEIALINTFGSIADGAHNPVGAGGGEIVQPPILPASSN